MRKPQPSSILNWQFPPSQLRRVKDWTRRQLQQHESALAVQRTVAVAASQRTRPDVARLLRRGFVTLTAGRHQPQTDTDNDSDDSNDEDDNDDDSSDEATGDEPNSQRAEQDKAVGAKIMQLCVVPKTVAEVASVLGE